MRKSSETLNGPQLGESEEPPKLPSHPAFEQVAPTIKCTTFYLVAALLTVVSSVAVSAGVYIAEQSKAKDISRQDSSLQVQIRTLEAKVTQQDATNNGVVSTGQIYKDPAGGIGLVSGAITFTMPKGWVRLPASLCAGGTIDSTAVCQDVATVAPSSLVKADGSATWGVNIGAYKYSSNDGSAKNWYETKYDGSPLSSYGVPEAINVSTAPINGYSALSFQFVSPPLDNPDYTNAHYVIVHGVYAVEVHSQVQISKKFGGGVASDYRSTYMPDIAQMVRTIKFQD